MTGCKRCALKGRKGGKEKKEKGGKNGDQNRFFSYAQWSFFKI